MSAPVTSTIAGPTGGPPLRTSASAAASSAGGRGSRWEALLMVPGLTANRSHRGPLVLKRAAPLFVGATVRVARSARWGHGRRRMADERARMPVDVLRVVWRVPDGLYEAQYGRLERLGNWELGNLKNLADREDELAASAVDDSAFEPQPVGRVVEAHFDPYEGIVGTVEFDPLAIDGAFVWVGAVAPGEPVTDAFARLHRTGHGDVLALSYVVSADFHPTTGPDGLACIDYDGITRVHFIDIVLFAATTARLIAPIT